MLMVSYFSESDILVYLHCFVLHLLSDSTVYGVFYVHWIIVILKLVLRISQGCIPLIAT